MKKTYALIKNNEVINKIIFDNPSEQLLDYFKNEHNVDLIVEANENISINGTFDGEKFWEPQPYKSWIKNEELGNWVAPIEKPEPIDHKYVWNEDLFKWDLAPIPEKPLPSFIFNENKHVWVPPVKYPNDGENYIWDEDSISWLLLPPSN